MRKIITIITICLALGATPLYAHHMAAGIVDEEIYAMIDDLVADTPHADLLFEDLGGGMTDLTVTAQSLRWLEEMIDDGLLAYLDQLDGEVSIVITFNEDGSVTLISTQYE